MKSRRAVCVVTGSRAEYGHLYWLMREIADHRRLELQIVVTGMHLAPRFGDTWRQIERDGFAIDAKVEMLLDGDSPVAVTKSMGLGLIGMADALERLKPDAVVVMGDRFEALVAAQAAMMARLPLAHIHGGEKTEGVIDDAVRHAITKMAHIHFVAAEPYRDRVIQLGENPTRVHLVGAPGLDHLGRTRLLGRKALAGSLDFNLGNSYFLVTYHPVTLRRRPAAGIGALLKALDRFPEQRVVITGVNADMGNDTIGRALADFASTRTDRVILRTSLGQRLYLSAMKHCATVIGNSSSGLVEAPALGIPTVNIGNRQRGRLRATSVIDCGESPSSITAAIRRALDPAFRRAARRTVSPFGDGRASARIAQILTDVDVDDLVIKHFHDIPVHA